MGIAVALHQYRSHECSAFGLLHEVVQSPVFAKEVGYNRFAGEDGNQVFIYGWSALGQTYNESDGSCLLLLMVDTFSGVKSKRKVMTMEVKIYPPSTWEPSDVIDRVASFAEELRTGAMDILIGGYRIFFGKENEARVVDYSVKAWMVNKLLEDEEKFELIEDRILYEHNQLAQYTASSWDIEKVNGYRVYRFRLATGKYLGVTAGCAWIGRSGQEASKMNVIYDLSKMSMSDARKRVKQSYQHKHITDMLEWFIHFSDMRKKMPTTRDIDSRVG